MQITDQINQDLKTALLAGEKEKVETLRVVKSALQNEAIATGVQSEGLSDGQALQVLAREAKKRLEAAELYKKAGEMERAGKEEAEKKIIETYLPAQASEADIAKAVEAEIAKLDNPTPADMGKVIGAVRNALGAGADGATIARIVKEKLS